MKTNAIVRICIYSLLILILVGILATVMHTDRLFTLFYADDHTSSGAQVSLPQDIPADQVSAIEIDWAAGDILIQSGDTDSISVTESKSSDQRAMVCKLKNGRLEIDYQEGDLNIGFGVHMDISKDLTVTVPRDLELREIELDIASAEVEIRDLAGTLDELDIDGASGTCTIENCEVRTLNVDTASGDVKFRGSLDELDFDAASADFVGVFENQPRSLKMDSMSGDLEITLPAGCGFQATIDAMSSQFAADQEVQIVNGAYVHGDGRCRIDVNGMSGDVNIHLGK